MRMFQAADLDTLAYAIGRGVSNLTADEIKSASEPFEPTLQSTNPLATFTQLRAAMAATVAPSTISGVPAECG